MSCLFLGYLLARRTSMCKDIGVILQCLNVHWHLQLVTKANTDNTVEDHQSHVQSVSFLSHLWQFRAIFWLLSSNGHSTGKALQQWWVRAMGSQLSGQAFSKSSHERALVSQMTLQNQLYIALCQFLLFLLHVIQGRKNQENKKTNLLTLITSKQEARTTHSFMFAHTLQLP